MKKWGILAACAAVLIIAALITVHTAQKGREKPFRDLRASDIVSASVWLAPPGRTIRIDDTKALAGLLKKLVIYEPTELGSDTLSGQSVVFTISLSDGSQKKVQPYHPYLEIDGTVYKTKYRPCEALNLYANRLMEERKDGNS